MASVNKVILIGNLGADPESRFMPNGDAVCNIRLATTESWKDKSSGEKREITEWHRVVFYRKLGEIAAQYLRKGSQIYVEGRIRTRKWTDKEGVERYTTEIEANDLTMLGARQSNGDSAPASRPAQAPARTGGGGNGAGKPNFDDLDDDIPFTDCDMGMDYTFAKHARSQRGRV